MTSTLDKILGDLDGGGDMIAALPVHENETQTLAEQF